MTVLFEENAKLTALLDHEKELTAWTPRLESFALASSGERTRGVMIIGIDTERENHISHLSQKLIAGTYLCDTDNAIMITEGLASYLKLHCNDTLILLGQGYESNMAAGKYRIKGIVKLAVPEMNKSMAWLPMAKSRDFLSTGSRYTSLSLMLDNRDKLLEVKHHIEQQTKGCGYEIMTWQEMIPELTSFSAQKWFKLR